MSRDSSHFEQFGHTGFMNSHDLTSKKPAPIACSRRAFFAAGATTAAAALLAACAGESVVAEAKTTDIPVDGATIISGWVVAQPKKGQFTAFSAECPHARGRINSIEERGDLTVAVCPKHGSEFDVATGDVVEGPSRDPMYPARDVQVTNNTVEVTN